MSNTSRLPAPMIIACYVAGGFCLFVSFQQMSQVFSAQGVDVGKAPLLPLAILTGGAVCWRLAGNMIARVGKGKARTFTAALIMVICAAGYTEVMSVSTSTIALSIGLQERAQAELQASDQYQQTVATQAAAGRAVAELANRLETMPASYRTMAGRTAEQIERLIQQQARLTELQADTGGTASTRAFTAAGERFGLSADDLAFRWALGVALAITLIPLSIQLALGSLSDGVLAERSASIATGSSTSRTDQNANGEQGNVRSLSNVRR